MDIYQINNYGWERVSRRGHGNNKYVFGKLGHLANRCYQRLNTNFPSITSHHNESVSANES